MYTCISACTTTTTISMLLNLSRRSKQFNGIIDCSNAFANWSYSYVQQHNKQQIQKVGEISTASYACNKQQIHCTHTVATLHCFRLAADDKTTTCTIIVVTARVCLVIAVVVVVIVVTTGTMEFELCMVCCQHSIIRLRCTTVVVVVAVALIVVCCCCSYW